MSKKPLKSASRPEPAPAPAAHADERLDSWKEIASYLKRGARTVQRWEREEGLPIHRLVHEKLGSIYAYRSELDQWWARRGAQPSTETAVTPGEEDSPSVAVLPFVDLSQEKDQSYFCEGVAEEIISALSRLRELRVASRTSSFELRTSGTDIREIGVRLGVRTVLEGSVRKSGDRLRIAVQLTDARSGFQLWSDRYEREMRDIFAIQDEIAENVVRSLEVTLTSAEKTALQKAPTRDIQAYDAYLRGRKYYYLYSPQAMEFALKMFLRAIEIDPDYAQAYAGLADCWSYVYLYSGRSEAVREQADWASAKALEMNAESAEAQASRGFSLSLGGRNEEAERAFESALRLDPGLFEASYFYARHAFALGQLEKAAGHYQGAMRVRPDDYQTPLLVAQIYDDLGRTADAAEARRRGIELAGKHLEMNPDDARALYMSANGLVALGERGRGRHAAQRALAIRPEDPMLLYNVGCVFSMLGMVEEAMDCLERAVRGGLTQRAWYERDSNLDPLRGETRFRELVREL